MQSTSTSTDRSEPLQRIVEFLLQRSSLAGAATGPVERHDPQSVAPALSTAFLRALGGDTETSAEAVNALDDMTSDPRWGGVAAFFLDGLDRIASELDRVEMHDLDRFTEIRALAEACSAAADETSVHDLYEHFASAFFPEGAGIRGNEDQRRDELRSRRAVAIENLPERPVVDPGRQVLLTTNALFTVPSPRFPDHSVERELAKRLDAIGSEPQEHWYDHPMPIGVSDHQNEITHGLRGMDDAVAFEKRRGAVDPAIALPVVMSASATHSSLNPLLPDHVRNLLQRSGGLRHLDVYIITELDARKLVNDTLVPAVTRFLPGRDPKLLDMIGVDGPYGRHYSFLKAAAAWWNVLIDPQVIATYKFDLDQTFPQDALVQETGRSAWEHLANPIWGAEATDSAGRSVELGMMAGSLVNESDIDSSLFTLDVTYPENNPTIDELPFWSALPQALSTEAEMGTRYRTLDSDEISSALQRVHVTGGTTAIRVDALRRHRPFTPGFIARAEDQAYLMSASDSELGRLACLHNDGLIMRHDKRGLAGDAITAAATGKLIADHERIILFSAYAEELSSSIEDLKTHLEPFTGCFISRLPMTVAYLRFALRSLRFFLEDEPEDGTAFIEQGAMRIEESIRFVAGPESPLGQQLKRERAAWDLFFDVLDVIEAAIARGDEFAMELAETARALLDDVALRPSD
jgi:hypothetical protein